VRGDDELGVLRAVVEDGWAFVEGGGRLRLVGCERGEGVEGGWFVEDFHCVWVVLFVWFGFVLGAGEVMVGVSGGWGLRRKFLGWWVVAINLGQCILLFGNPVLLWQYCYRTECSIEELLGMFGRHKFGVLQSRYQVSQVLVSAF